MRKHSFTPRRKKPRTTSRTVELLLGSDRLGQTNIAHGGHGPECWVRAREMSGSEAAQRCTGLPDWPPGHSHAPSAVTCSCTESTPIPMETGRCGGRCDRSGALEWALGTISYPWLRLRFGSVSHLPGWRQCLQHKVRIGPLLGDILRAGNQQLELT